MPASLTHGARVLLTIGAQELGHYRVDMFSKAQDKTLVVHCVLVPSPHWNAKASKCPSKTKLRPSLCSVRS